MLEENKIIGQYPHGTVMQESSTKYQQTEFSGTLKGSYTMIELKLFQGRNNDSRSVNQCDIPH